MDSRERWSLFWESLGIVVILGVAMFGWFVLGA